MNNKIRRGILGAANIAVKKIVPAMQKGTWTDVAAIASRDAGKAKRAASSLNIPKFYGLYEELLADPEIEAVFRVAKSGKRESPETF